MNIEELIELFSVKCNNNHVNCNKINDSLNILIETEKYVPTIEFIDDYIIYMIQKYNRCCLKTEKTKQCLFLMIKKTCPVYE